MKPNILKIQYITAVFLFFGMVAFGIWHAALGIDLTDEGFYLSTSMRYALGDTPFQDEFTNAIRPFDLLISPVFLVFPEISLFQMRMIGLMIQISGLLFIFLVLSRYGPPILAATACGIDFFLNNTILTPSYNLLSQSFSLISVSFYLFACVGPTLRRRILFSVLGGFFFGLCVISYYSFIVGLALPVFTGVACFFCLPCKRMFFTPSLSFVGGCAFTLTMFTLFIGIHGLFPELAKGISMMKSITPLGSSPWKKLIVLFAEMFKTLPYGFCIIGVWMLSFFVVPKQKRNSFDYAFPAVGALALFLIPAITQWPLHTGAISIAIILSVAAILLWNYTYIFKKRNLRPWQWINAYLILWGLSMALIYGMSSGNSFYQCRKALAPLLGAGILFAHHIIASYLRSTKDDSFRKTVWPKLIYIAPIPFLFFSMQHSGKNIYRDLPPNQLKCQFSHPKLNNIHSTCDKVDAIEDLLFYLEKKVDKGDYFLAYNYIPMLYYLTHAKPAYGAAWARDDWPLSVREKLVEKMIQKNRIPNYCIRMLAFPSGRWNAPMFYEKNSPLDRFVKSRYCLEHIIFPFEIWKHGEGPKLRLFESRKANFSYNFSDWPSGKTIAADKLNQFKPLILQNMNGQFHFVKNPNGKGVRISPSGKENHQKMAIQFAYALPRNFFNTMNPDKPNQVIFILKAKLSHKPVAPNFMMIQDHVHKWEINSVPLYESQATGHIVSKKIRNGSNKVYASILWQPQKQDEWLDIYDIQIFIGNRRIPFDSHHLP